MAVRDVDRAEIEDDFKTFGGVTFTLGNHDSMRGQPHALLHDPDGALANLDVNFLLSESSAFIGAIMTLPADKNDGRQLTDYLKIRLQLLPVERGWPAINDCKGL